MFKDRVDAGYLLVEKLKKYRKDPGVVLAVPRGGVPVAFPVAKELGFPIDLILTKKIGHPLNKEYAIGAASLTDYIITTHEGVSEEYIQEEVGLIRERLKEMYKKFMGQKEPEALNGKTVIMIDDGVATGNTLMATIYLLQKSKPGKIIIAVPVASRTAVRKLAGEVDEVVCVYEPDDFYGVGAFYEDFSQVSDSEILFYLDKLRELRKAG